jgi:alpha-tubulin suppressor-like RCC1 family protein
MSSVWVWKESVVKNEAAPPTPREISGLPEICRIAAERGTLVMLGADGRVWTWKAERDTFKADGPDLPDPISVPNLTDVVDIVSADGANYAIKSDGTLWAWGDNGYGQLGDGTTEARATPVPVLNMSHVVAVTSEKNSTFAVRDDGSVWAWGRDHSGTLGDGTQFPPLRQVTSPVKLPDLTDVVTVSTAFPYSSTENGYALRSDGTVWAWGDSADGQLGDGTTEGRWTPVPVASLSGVTALATASSISHDSHVTAFALRSDGTIWAWGANDGGQLGDGTKTNRAAPTRVMDLADITAVSPHCASAYALKTDGTVWFWGSNRYSTRSEVPITHHRPVQLTGLPPIATINAELSPAYATGVDGSVWRWDHDWASPPERVLSLSGVSVIAQSPLQFSAALEGAAETLRPTSSNSSDASSTSATNEADLLERAYDHYQEGEVEEAESEWRTAAGQGSAQAMFNLGVHYQRAGDLDEAVRWFTLSADAGNPMAMYQVGHHHHRSGRESDAIGLIQKAAALGLPQAQRALIETQEPIRIGQAELTAHGFQLRFPEDGAGSLYRTATDLAASDPPRIVNLSDGGKTSLMHWSSVGDEDQVEAMLQQGADVNAVDTDGDSALYYAVSNGNVHIVDVLLNRGANPNIAGRSGNPLQVAADKGSSGVVTNLVKHGADVDNRGDGGLTATMLAAGSGKIDVLRSLCGAGAHLDALDDDGDSALFYAASRGRVDAVSLLLEQGANASPRAGASGQTPLSIATILSTSNHPLPPGTTRSDFAAVARLLTPRSPVSPPLRPPVPTPASPAPRPIAPPASTTTRVEVLGSTQAGFANSPAITIYWNGKQVGTVEHGGRFAFDIATAGEVRFKWKFRSRKLQLEPNEATIRVQLSWDRTWGRLIASKVLRP